MEHHPSTEAGAGNNRNGYGRKTVITATGLLPLDIPRDRTASFEPQLVAKHQRRLSGFDDRVIADVCARHEHARDRWPSERILRHRGLAGPGSGTVTDAVLDEVAALQGRPLEPLYLIVFFDVQGEGA